MPASRTPRHLAYGDFQTPPALARQVCRVLSARAVDPACVLEPTCGTGSFLAAAHETFAHLHRLVGVDVDAAHLTAARSRLPSAAPVELLHADLFSTDLSTLVCDLPEPVLAVGNPPWVTVAQLSRLRSPNSPPRTSSSTTPSIQALTGQSNFDVSEWIVTSLIRALREKRATASFLVKTSVARRVLLTAWQEQAPVTDATMHRIDARAHFGAAVDACLLTCTLGSGQPTTRCQVLDDLGAARPSHAFGLVDRRLVADVDTYRGLAHLSGPSPVRWRSGVKHDCARVMELRVKDGVLKNGLGETVDIENDHVLPLLKGTDVARGRTDRPDRFVIVPQRTVSEDTCALARTAPRTWRYLMDHAGLLDSRKSRIYRGRPRFSIFGVGDYTFAPYKVAVSALHADLRFRLVPPRRGRPVVFDDTVAFLSFSTLQQARKAHRLLTTDEARDFYASQIFTDSKRPVTIRLLSTLDLDEVTENS